jgi:hypothetical protein
MHQHRHGTDFVYIIYIYIYEVVGEVICEYILSLGKFRVYGNHLTFPWDLPEKKKLKGRTLVHECLRTIEPKLAQVTKLGKQNTGSLPSVAHGPAGMAIQTRNFSKSLFSEVTEGAKKKTKNANISSPMAQNQILIKDSCSHKRPDRPWCLSSKFFFSTKNANISSPMAQNQILIKDSCSHKFHAHSCCVSLKIFFQPFSEVTGGAENKKMQISHYLWLRIKF